MQLENSWEGKRPTVSDRGAAGLKREIHSWDTMGLCEQNCHRRKNQGKGHC